MSELPKGWSKCQLGNLVEFKYGKALPAKTRTNTGFPVYGSGGTVGYHEEFLVEGPVIVIGRKGSYGSVYKIDSPSFPIDTTYYIDRLYDQPIEFWFRYLQYLPLDQMNRSSAIPGLNRQDAYNLIVSIPPLNEQIRIANKLDSILAKVDKAQARLDKIPAILKRFRQSVLAAATSGELTKEWRAIKGIDFEEWTETKLSEVATSLDPNPSHRYPKSDSSGVPILSTQQFVGESGWTTDKAKLVNREFYEERKEKTGFFENDIIFARKGRLGLARFAPMNMEFVFSHTVFIVRASEKVKSDYLLWYLRDEQSLEWLVKEMNSNTGVPTLGKGVFEKLPINLPCGEEQSEIVSRIERFFSRANKIEKQYLDAKARLDRLTQSILAKAFRGELVPQDPNDEPAEKLLERILAEKEQSEPKKTTRKRMTNAKTAEKE
ncbi:restriction endonuclease subunit S [Vibrio parahaemolyticus]|uniref:restriction endonuclease subunit S n=1 Tax=Vibrio parahaemolyticus TaxID=670 RepID=UPI0004A4A79F|nr:restriction endonuclease subunit S [Vibrio parahaemolyticus]EGR3405965.1 restriction endonuclease subunit S [Vibrio parahaemolyticus]EHH1171783.1 restriction endonuclease subunit S [Vibrio parahaemolyticus]EJS9605367.1 restriction endonuclease subunit S [Vibrio parahaemolyticus]MDF4888262.1 restriction endonuclease subunit S [Vibrio parahaemolyticus]MDF5457769.1 restriction endonuclease subunit S [Vibrio parahaemolyticus]